MHAPNENEATKLHIPEVRNETSCKDPTRGEQEEQYPPNHSKAEMCQLSTSCLEPALSCCSTQPVTKQGEQTAQHLHSPSRCYASTSHQLHSVSVQWVQNPAALLWPCLFMPALAPFATPGSVLRTLITADAQHTAQSGIWVSWLRSP